MKLGEIELKMFVMDYCEILVVLSSIWILLFKIKFFFYQPSTAKYLSRYYLLSKEQLRSRIRIGFMSKNS